MLGAEILKTLPPKFLLLYITLWIIIYRAITHYKPILQTYVDKFIILNVAQVTSLIAIYQHLIFCIKILKI